MPVNNGVGHSGCTPHKQSGLAAILAQHISIVQAVLKNHPWAPQHYIYVDLFAGTGTNPDEECDGSPVIFLKAMRGRMPYEAHLVEIEPNNNLLLRETVGVNPPHYCYLGDNRDFLPEILSRINQKSYGLIYADPNGMADLELLSQCQLSHRHLDILIHYPAAAGKRNGRSLKDYLDAIGKSVWIIQEPMGRWQWTFLFGTNYSDYKAWRKHGFYRLDEPRGQEIFDRLNLTTAERLAMHQPALMELSPRQQVMKRARGLCERCKRRAGLQVHHLSYEPPTERPDNLIAICYPCHCEIHGKEQ